MSYKPVPKSRWYPPDTDGTTPILRSATAAPSEPARAHDDPVGTVWGNLRWRALVGLGLVWLSIGTSLYTPWALLMLWWSITDIRRGQTWLIETVCRNANPVVFWALLATWFALAALLLGLDALHIEPVADLLHTLEE